MKTDRGIDKIMPAFVKALAAMEDVTKSKKVNAGPMKYSYADLGAVLDAVKPHLVENDLVVTQWPDSDGVHTMLRSPTPRGTMIVIR